MSTIPLRVTAVGVSPKAARVVVHPGMMQPEDICRVLAAWADAANISNEGAGKGSLAIWKSDLLNRLIWGGEKGPSKTPCPVHEGRWSGMHSGWPGSVWRSVVDGKLVDRPMEVEARLQEWWDAGCRCATHQGSDCTTGWQPDKACGCADD